MTYVDDNQYGEEYWRRPVSKWTIKVCGRWYDVSPTGPNRQGRAMPSKYVPKGSTWGGSQKSRVKVIYKKRKRYY